MTDNSKSDDDKRAMVTAGTSMLEFQRLEHRLFGFARSKFPGLEPEDVVQDGFTRFLEHPPKYVQQDKLFSLLCYAISWTAIEKLRKPAAVTEFTSDSEQPDRSSPCESWLFEIKSDIELGLRTLSMTERRVVESRLMDMTYLEIAAELKCCGKTVSRIHKQALAKLKRFLD